MFMYHKNPSYNAWEFSEGWKCNPDIHSAQDVADLIIKYHNSPCLWAHGVRLKVNFRRAYWVGLDFDEGVTLKDATQIFGSYVHVIGTTKSHGIKPGDRFRVFIKLNDVCRNQHDYEATVTRMIKDHKADIVCCDAARLFFKCNEIYSINYSGKVMPIVDSSKEIEKKEKKLKQYQEKIKANYAPGKFITGWAKYKLDAGVPNGTRNHHVYSIAKELGRCGFSESEALEKILNSRIPIDNSDKVIAEVTSVVKRAFL